MSNIDSDAPEDSIEVVSRDESDSNDSFLSILDEKNKVIENLQEQLANQKVQILYYMKKELKSTKLIELSNTCVLDNLEHSLPVVLSLEHFRRENGIKSNLSRLYEYMRGLDQKLSKALNCQELILRKIIEKFCMTMKNSNFNINLKVPHLYQQNICVDLFGNLLDATLGLRKGLDCFRICCSRLLLIEDERNNLIEQVVALPANEKLNCNFLMAAKQDKIELEKKIHRLLIEKQGISKEELKELGEIDKKLSEIQQELKTYNQEVGDFTGLGDMVNNLNFEANCLLRASKNHQEKCLCNQINKNKVGNIIVAIKEVFSGKKINESEYTKEELGIIDIIKKGILEVSKNECDKLKDYETIYAKLNEALVEKNKLNIANIHLRSCIQQLQKSFNSEIVRLKLQKDNLEIQVGRLEELRKSYIELVIMPNSEHSIKEADLTQTIINLERKLQLMKEIIEKQNKEILIQSEFIEILKHQDKKSINSLIYKQEDEIKELLINEFSKCVEDTENVLPLKNAEIKDLMNKIVQILVNDSKSKKKSNLSSYSVQIKCSCTSGCGHLPSCNESELMRDCSDESLANFCKPIQKNKENNDDVEDPRSPIEGGYSRNIEVLVQNNNRLKNSSSDECKYESSINT